jgi:hypothetical protein
MPANIPRHQRPCQNGALSAATLHARVPAAFARRTKVAAEAGLGAGIGECGLLVQGAAAR